MPSGYHHLGYDERAQIGAMISMGLSLRRIVKRLGRSASTISRELQRNQEGGSYQHEQAQELSQNRRSEGSSRCHKITAEVLAVIESLLRSCQFSPEQIAGRLKMEGVVAISHTRIYQHIWQDREQGADLYRHLQHRGKKYNGCGKGAGRGVIRNRIDIRKRLAVVEEKIRVGDWEFDTVVGPEHRGVLVTLAHISHQHRKSVVHRQIHLGQNDDFVLKIPIGFWNSVYS